MRPENSDLLLSAFDEQDFLSIVRSAGSANICVEIGWIFHGVESARGKFGHCFLRLELSNGCVDERLTVFLEALRRDEVM